MPEKIGQTFFLFYLMRDRLAWLNHCPHTAKIGWFKSPSRNMDSRKRTRCKICRKRVNLAWKKENGRFFIFCPKCGGNGDVRVINRK